MLTSILKRQHEHFAAFAETWLLSGAAAVSIWSNGSLVQQWPAEARESPGEIPFMSVPLRTGDHVLGELRVFGLNGSVARERLLNDGALLAQLIRLEDDLEDMTAELVESQDQLLALYDLARHARSHLDIPQTLESLVRITARLTNVQTSFILLNMPDSLRIFVHPTSPVEKQALIDLYTYVHDNDQELLIESPHSTYDLPSGIYNLCVMPIHINGEIIAALGLLNRPEGFSPQAMQLIRAITSQANAQIENVLLHQESLEQTKLQTEMDLAAQAQLHLLPQNPPDIVGLDIYAETRPALNVGGDFYDFIWQPGRPLIFSVGDIAGKGMSAALLMAMSRTSIRSKASFMPNATPAMIMSRSNDDLFEDFVRMRKFATVFVGQYEPQRHELRYTNAGHAPAIYGPLHGSARLLEANGAALGLTHVNAYRNDALRLSPGDVLIIATDGFSDARNRHGEVLSFDRLLDLTDTIKHQPVQDIAQAWFENVEQFEAGYPQDDDQTIIVIKVALAADAP